MIPDQHPLGAVPGDTDGPGVAHPGPQVSLDRSGPIRQHPDDACRVDAAGGVDEADGELGSVPADVDRRDVRPIERSVDRGHGGIHKCSIELADGGAVRRAGRFPDGARARRTHGHAKAVHRPYAELEGTSLEDAARAHLLALHDRRSTDVLAPAANEDGAVKERLGVARRVGCVAEGCPADEVPCPVPDAVEDDVSSVPDTEEQPVAIRREVRLVGASGRASASDDVARALRHHAACAYGREGDALPGQTVGVDGGKAATIGDKRRGLAHCAVVRRKRRVANDAHTVAVGGAKVCDVPILGPTDPERAVRDSDRRVAGIWNGRELHHVLVDDVVHDPVAVLVNPIAGLLCREHFTGAGAPARAQRAAGLRAAVARADAVGPRTSRVAVLRTVRHADADLVRLPVAVVVLRSGAELRSLRRHLACAGAPGGAHRVAGLRAGRADADPVGPGRAAVTRCHLVRVAGAAFVHLPVAALVLACGAVFRCRKDLAHARAVAAAVRVAGLGSLDAQAVAGGAGRAVVAGDCAERLARTALVHLPVAVVVFGRGAVLGHWHHLALARAEGRAVFKAGLNACDAHALAFRPRRSGVAGDCACWCAGRGTAGASAAASRTACPTARRSGVGARSTSITAVSKLPGNPGSIEAAARHQHEDAYQEDFFLLFQGNVLLRHVPNRGVVL